MDASLTHRKSLTVRYAGAITHPTKLTTVYTQGGKILLQRLFQLEDSGDRHFPEIQ